MAAVTHRFGSSAGSPGNREAPCHSLAGNNHLITWCCSRCWNTKKKGGGLSTWPTLVFSVCSPVCLLQDFEKTSERTQWGLGAGTDGGYYHAPSCPPQLSSANQSSPGSGCAVGHSALNLEKTATQGKEWSALGRCWEKRKSTMRKNTCCIM